MMKWILDSEQRKITRYIKKENDRIRRGMGTSRELYANTILSLIHNQNAH